MKLFENIITSSSVFFLLLDGSSRSSFSRFRFGLGVIFNVSEKKFFITYYLIFQNHQYCSIKVVIYIRFNKIKK